MRASGTDERGTGDDWSCCINSADDLFSRISIRELGLILTGSCELIRAVLRALLFVLRRCQVGCPSCDWCRLLCNATSTGAFSLGLLSHLCGRSDMVKRHTPTSGLRRLLGVQHHTTSTTRPAARRQRCVTRAAFGGGRLDVALLLAVIAALQQHFGLSSDDPQALLPMLKSFPEVCARLLAALESTLLVGPQAHGRVACVMPAPSYVVSRALGPLGTP